MAASTKTTSRTKALARRLLDLDERTMSSKLLKQFEGLAEKMFEDMATATGEYLHHLDAREDIEDEVKAVVKKFPSALSHRNEKGLLPIQSAVMYSESVPCVPLLAELGDKLNVGGEGMRGGLLVGDPVDEDNDNVLQLPNTRRFYSSTRCVCRTSQYFFRRGAIMTTGTYRGYQSWTDLTLLHQS